MAEHDSRKKSCPHTTVLHLGNADFEALVPSLVRRGASFLDFAARRLRPPIVISAVLLLLAAPASAQRAPVSAQSSRTQPTQPLSPSPLPSPSPSPSPTLTLTFNPQMPSVQDTVPLGTVIAIVTAARSDGSPFTGTLTFGSPYADDGGTFALSCQSCATANIVVSPTGLGLMDDGGTVQQIRVVATQ
jgi:hypothetical protein